METSRNERNFHVGDIMLTIVVTIVCSIFASSGFWTYLMHRQSVNSSEEKLLLGVAYYSICNLAAVYLSRGHVTRQEYADFQKYLYDPYIARGGNGTAKRLWEEINKLPIREE